MSMETVKVRAVKTKSWVSLKSLVFSITKIPLKYIWKMQNIDKVLKNASYYPTVSSLAHFFLDFFPLYF